MSSSLFRQNTNRADSFMFCSVKYQHITYTVWHTAYECAVERDTPLRSHLYHDIKYTKLKSFK